MATLLARALQAADFGGIPRSNEYEAHMLGLHTGAGSYGSSRAAGSSSRRARETRQLLSPAPPSRLARERAPLLSGDWDTRARGKARPCQVASQILPRGGR